MVSKGEYIAPLILFEHGKIARQAVCSNISEVVEHQQYIFDNFWNKAIPAEDRINEIEEGIVSTGIRLIENQDEIIYEIKRKNNSANKLSICSTFANGLQSSLFDSYKNVVDKHKYYSLVISITQFPRSDDDVSLFVNSTVNITARQAKTKESNNFKLYGIFYFPSIGGFIRVH